jgi:phosphoglycerol transferase MdoB-like AlkP superfamily enzyme
MQIVSPKNYVGQIIKLCNTRRAVLAKMDYPTDKTAVFNYELPLIELVNNFFDELYTSEDYPSEKIVGPFGVPEDFVFSFAIDRLNKIDESQPFFATILTTSNHDPYILPDYFKWFSIR